MRPAAVPQARIHRGPAPVGIAVARRRPAGDGRTGIGRAERCRVLRVTPARTEFGGAGVTEFGVARGLRGDLRGTAGTERPPAARRFEGTPGGPATVESG